MSRFLSLDELLNKKKPQVSKVVETPVVETPKVEDAPVIETPVVEDIPAKHAKKGGKKTTTES